jgi:hypothetical protein
MFFRPQFQEVTLDDGVCRFKILKGSFRETVQRYVTVKFGAIRSENLKTRDQKYGFTTRKRLLFLKGEDGWIDSSSSSSETWHQCSAAVGWGPSSSELARRRPAMSNPERHALAVARPCLGTNVPSPS